MKRCLLPLFFCAFPFTAMAAEPDAETLKAAEETMKAIGIEQQTQNGFNFILPTIYTLAQRTKLSREAAEEMKGLYHKWFLENIDQEKLRKKFVSIYAENYTKEELKELTRFYKSAVGQKTLVTMQKIMNQSSGAVAQELQTKQPELQELVKPFLEKHGVKVEAAPPAAPTTPAPAFPAPAPAR